MDLAPGRTFAGRYRIERVLGSGGSGTAFLARDGVFSRWVTLKVLAQRSAEQLAAFQREFSLLQALVHPGLPDVHDFGIAPDVAPRRGRPFYTARYVDGVSLDQFAIGKRWPDVLPPIADALRALDFLHASGVRHGDVKPQNIIVAASAAGVLVDLGCSERLGAPAAGMVSATPAYAAPELLAGDAVDRRADLFSVGKMLERVSSALSQPPPRHVLALAARLTRQRPADRPADVPEVLEALKQHAEPATSPRSFEVGLLGRAAELAVLDAALSALARGASGGQSIHIHGPTGIGRSRLLREAKWRAQLAGTIDVAESHAETPRPCGTLLAQALGDDTAVDDVPGVLAGYERLRSRTRPVMLLLDDADRLPIGELRLLTALARSIEPSDPVLLVTTGETPLFASVRGAQALALGPLDASAVQAWARSGPLHEHAERLLRLTGGVPAELMALSAALPSGASSGADLERIAHELAPGEHRSARISVLDPPQRHALAALAASGGALGDEELMAEGVTREALETLIAGSVIVRQAAGFRLARATDAGRIERIVGASVMKPLHLARAARLAEPAESESDVERARRVGRRAEHLALGGASEDAGALLTAHLGDAAAEPQAFRSAAAAIAASTREPQVLLAVAEILELAGDARAALRCVARALRRRPTAAESGAALLRAGSCYLSLGDTRRATRALTRALATRTPSAALASGILGRALLKKGDSTEALAIARAGLQLGSEPAVRVELLTDAALAASYVGEVGAAREYLEHAVGCSDAVTVPMTVFRLLCARALIAYREGRIDVAVERYAEALELAERRDLGDRVVVAAQNFGVACHQSGDWARADAAYARGLRLATALGITSTEVSLRFNLAKLHADVGWFARARSEAERAALAAETAGMRFMQAASESLRGEIALWTGDEEEAGIRLRRARELFRTEGAARELAEVDLDLALVDLQAGRIEQARALASAATQSSSQLDADDLLARAELVEAAIASAAGRAADAVTKLERAASLASRAHRRMLEAEIEARLADAFAARGAEALSTRHRLRARELCERTAVTLPETMRDAFWAHPARRGLIEVTESPPPAPNETLPRLRHLLAINRRLSSADTADQVLELAMDAAVELTSAERGFLLLLTRTEGGRPRFRVPVARNLDRETLGRKKGRFSRSIAERVVTSGEVVLTIDALADDRFAGEASVHAMRLKAVVCVPIRDGQGTLGAIYLDHRFERGRFREQDAELLLAFADQVAIALRKADLVDALRRRSDELEAERARVRALLSDREEQVERLTEQLADERRRGGRAHDYPEIVGEGPAMRRVFEVLDRVAASTVSVLVSGESGTGKELVARALHVRSERREQPFVAVNCGALPENLLEAELFGYVRGAFTGAVRDHAGLFAAAQGGTLLLDEIGEMAPSSQVKLLRVLQEREVRPVGASQAHPVDVRLVFATNRQLRDEVAAGRFREDLFYRIAVVEVALPALRERPEDIPALAARILSRAAVQLGRRPPRLEQAALRALVAHAWPGNVRQLENVLTRACLMAESEVVRREDLAFGRAVPDAAQATEARRILDELEATRWNAREAAAKLGIPRATFYRTLRRLGISRPSRTG